ncbi:MULTISPECIES: hypothetical protein [Methanosarcina]|uniref:Uncharacterized protein n=1 Tax=Methanosarcina barkeri CM1 TaxID=796385 RepID=A0A0G3CJG6_METBA|nr:MULTISPECIES: hypothetical protein [Methanosarcina]AKJ40083.1 hypothetical protein MCM1_3094 [Methanosarcina barkeri CM1]OEC91169.1 hypothetical protein A9239_03465 [Methanosarcina sp. A14]
MSGKKSLIIFAGICILLVGIVILNPFMQHNSPTGKEENNVEEENNSESVDPNSFFINNWGNANHEVTVELLNSKNTSVFSKSYSSVPGKTIKDKFSITPVPGGEIVVTLDNDITKTQTVSENSTSSILYVDVDMLTSNPLDLSIVLP